MIQDLKLIPKQLETISSAFSQMGQVITLFSLGALFVPESVNLSKDFPHLASLMFLIGGLMILAISIIIVKKIN